MAIIDENIKNRIKLYLNNSFLFLILLIIVPVIMSGNVAAQEKEFDVLGIKLGDTHKDIGPAIVELEKECGQKLKYFSYNSKILLTSIRQCSSPSGQQIYLEFRVTYFNDQIVSVSLSYSSPNDIKGSKLVAELQKKYGTPIYPSNPALPESKYDRQFLWAIDLTTGTPYECRWPDSGHAKTECGKTLRVRFWQHDDDKISDYRIQMIDQITIAKALEGHNQKF